jgi:uncharacterized protein YeaO (DUF488 family)
MSPKLFEKNPNAWYQSIAPKNRTVEFFVRMFEESLEDMSQRYPLELGEAQQLKEEK